MVVSFQNFPKVQARFRHGVHHGNVRDIHIIKRLCEPKVICFAQSVQWESERVNKAQFKNRRVPSFLRTFHIATRESHNPLHLPEREVVSNNIILINTENTC